MKKIVKIFFWLVLAFVAYIIMAYVFKQAIIYYYEQRDKKYDWAAEYQDTKIKDKYKIVFIGTSGVIADKEAAYRIISACKRLGWETHVFENIDDNQERIKAINPDFIFTNNWKTEIGIRNSSLKYKAYALLPHPIATYFGGFFSFYPKFKEKKFPELKFFDGFVISTPQIGLFKNYIEAQGHKFYGFQGYSAVQYQEYVEVEPKQIIYMGINWDKKRKSSKFGKVFKNLAENKGAVFYGAAESWQNLVGDAYQGYFEGEGSAVIEILRKHGISLIIHSNQHIKSGAPSARAFEAAASGAIAISDQHPFLIETFGDNFLYIDTSKSAESITEQISKHLEWIRKNPDKVKEMTRNAYDIFITNYTLERLLINLAHMHEKILLDDKLIESQVGF